MSSKSRDLTILFADVSGSTRLYEDLGDQKAQEVIALCIQFLSDVVVKNHGVVIKTIGDEVMCRFDTPDDAARAACEIQEVNQGGKTYAGQSVSYRIGLHHGNAIMETDGDIFGDAVNVAARMASIAKVTQIITTGETVDLLSSPVAELAREFDRATVRGKSELMRICEVVWEKDTGDVTRIVSPIDMSSTRTAVLKLRFRGKEIEIASGKTPIFSIGRGSQCDLVVPANLASRVHARFEFSRGKFTLVDQSTNGTFVRTQDGEDVYLRRDPLLMWGAGIISLGEEISDRNQNLIHFLCP